MFQKDLLCSGPVRRFLLSSSDPLQPTPTPTDFVILVTSLSYPFPSFCGTLSDCDILPVFIFCGLSRIRIRVYWSLGSFHVYFGSTGPDLRQSSVGTLQ